MAMMVKLKGAPSRRIPSSSGNDLGRFRSSGESADRRIPVKRVDATVRRKRATGRKGNFCSGFRGAP